jgi:hypothetical protein
MIYNCFKIYLSCYTAIYDGKLIYRENYQDKEYHFQNWCKQRIDETDLLFESGGRNTFPDFSLVQYTEGYEIKGLSIPGRENNFDANSNIPAGHHNGREIFYIFGRYPKKSDDSEYAVNDLVLCHGDFLSINHDYQHKNMNIKGFGSYGDIMIRDRKMYVVPTPFALTDGTIGLSTLIVPSNFTAPDDFQCVGELERRESDKLLIGYSFDLRTNKIKYKIVNNHFAGTTHLFKAYRHKSQCNKTVSMR